MNLNSLNLFVKVVQKGSFTAAAQETNVPVATVSRRISELEKSLNLRLLERSTRKLRMTDSGVLLFEYASRGIDEFEAGKLALEHRETEVSGVLRLSAPPHFEPWWDLLRDFQTRYKNVEVEVFVSERKISFIEDGVDVALRVGEVDNLSAIAREVHQYRHKLVASAVYIEKFGSPKTPSDLINFPCVSWYKKQNNINWVLGNNKVSLKTNTRANDYLHMRNIALNHKAITELPPFLAKHWLDNGQLIEVLPDFPMPLYRINLVYPSRKQISKISKVYIDFCVKNAVNYF
ncbi:LysR family transcriptional regulator [Paraglaciecola sp.]|uniref:LysR family transcriptional regulator n=1 Tax=Paraglaciecola sp. TaxID=1920173 RepID=UPI003EF6E8B0